VNEAKARVLSVTGEAVADVPIKDVTLTEAQPVRPAP
jgi:hypothetical protein